VCALCARASSRVRVCAIVCEYMCVCVYVYVCVCVFACEIPIYELQYEPFFIKHTHTHLHMHAPTHTLKCIKIYAIVLNLCSETLSEGRTSQPLSCESSLRLGLRNEVGRFLCVRVYECVCVRVRVCVRVIVFGSVCVRQKHRQGHWCGYGHRYRNRYT